MRLLAPCVASLLTLSLAAQDDHAARWRIGLGLGAGTLDFNDDLPTNGDSNAAGAFRLGFEGTSSRGFGGGLRVESFAAEDLEFGGSTNDFDVGFASMFGHFTYRVQSHRFAMPVRIGPMIHVLTKDDTTSVVDDTQTHSTFGVMTEIAPEFTLARRGSTTWTLYGELGLGAGGTLVERDDVDDEWDSSSVFTGLELGTRVYLGVCELSLAYVGRWQSMDESDPGDLGGPRQPGYDASFHGALLGFAVVF